MDNDNGHNEGQRAPNDEEQPAPTMTLEEMSQAAKELVEMDPAELARQRSIWTLALFEQMFE